MWPQKVYKKFNFKSKLKTTPIRNLRILPKITRTKLKSRSRTYSLPFLSIMMKRKSSLRSAQRSKKINGWVQNPRNPKLNRLLILIPSSILLKRIKLSLLHRIPLTKTKNHRAIHWNAMNLSPKKLLWIFSRFWKDKTRKKSWWNLMISTWCPIS